MYIYIYKCIYVYIHEGVLLSRVDGVRLGLRASCRRALACVAEQLQRAEAAHSPRLRVCRLLKEQLLYKKKRGRRLRFYFTEILYKVALQKSIPAQMRQPILCQYGHEE